jgi:hypothetical protein
MVALVVMPPVMVPIAYCAGVAPHLHHAALLIEPGDLDHVNLHLYPGLRLSQSTNLRVGVTPLHREPDTTRVNKVCSAIDKIAQAGKGAADYNIDTFCR